MALSARSVERVWAHARAWLSRELSGLGSQPNLQSPATNS